eukprot:2777611-Prymnesium_polylepis.1
MPRNKAGGGRSAIRDEAGEEAEDVRGGQCSSSSSKYDHYNLSDLAGRCRDEPTKTSWRSRVMPMQSTRKERRRKGRSDSPGQLRTRATARSHGAEPCQGRNRTRGVATS